MTVPVPDHHNGRFSTKTNLVVSQEHNRMVRRNVRIRSEEETARDKIRSLGEVGTTAISEAADVAKWAESTAHDPASARVAAQIYDTFEQDLNSIVRDHGHNLRRI